MGLPLVWDQYSIPPGSSGTVQVHVEQYYGVLYPDSQDSNYASAVFDPSYFDSNIVSGNTDLTVTFHLPPGVKPDEPKWHAAPDGFPSHQSQGLIARADHIFVGKYKC